MALWDRDRQENLDSQRRAAWRIPVTVRIDAPDDAGAIERLAALESRPPPPGPHLLAERQGRVDAALSLSTGELLADPFRRTAEACELLRCHAGGLRAAPTTAPLSRLRPLPVPATT